MKAKKKWVASLAWAKACKPVVVGLGIHGLGPVQQALHIKLAQRFFYGNSLWSDYSTTKHLKCLPFSTTNL